LAVCLLTAACGTDPVEQWLTRAEACVEVNADSALRCLQYIEGTGACSDEQRARYALLRTQAMHKCRIPLESDSLINTAVAYYANSDDRHRLALSLLYKGLVHKQNHQVEQAVEAFVGSEQAFEGVEDNQYKALLFNHYGALLMNQGVYEEALDYSLKSYQYKLLGDSIHYIVSSCSQIAKLYKVLNMSDSAKAYYERGLSYVNGLSRKQYYYALLQNYASFLMQNGELEKAERLFKECEINAPSEISDNVYSALATFYQIVGRYEDALQYCRRTLQSTDSLTVCGGYLRLYKIYKDMGVMDSALYYHNLYRQYNSDITLRRQTAKVAAIPHKMKSMQLAKENRALTGWRLWLMVGLVGVSVVATAIYVSIKRKHRLEQTEKERELAESQTSLHETQTSLADTQHQLTKTKVDLGQVRGVLTHQTHAFDRMKQSLEEMKKKHQTDIRQQKENIRKLEADIQVLKENDRTRSHAESELKQSIKGLGLQLKAQTDKLQHVEHQRAIDQRIEYFLSSGNDSIAVDLLLQLRLDKRGTFRYDIKPSEYLPLLKVLLEQESPALHERLENSGLEWKKLTMCYLMALGLDDVEMMSRAACLAVSSVKRYRKECREVVESLRRGQ
ncbi:MAG: tetratricopeptide repeat protein, partial [Bacteroidaceae bacterium]|nr:tetratricopeptide repeat protein [Bacteroidaceae bacterium]